MTVSRPNLHKSENKNLGHRTIPIRVDGGYCSKVTLRSTETMSDQWKQVPSWDHTMRLVLAPNNLPASRKHRRRICVALSLCRRAIGRIDYGTCNLYLVKSQSHPLTSRSEEIWQVKLPTSSQMRQQWWEQWEKRKNQKKENEWWWMGQKGRERWKSKRSKHLIVGPLLEVETSAGCTPLWH